MKKLTKGKAFWAGLTTLTLLFGITAAFVPSALTIIGPAIVWAVPALVVSFSGSNVADNWTKGKYYRPELEGK